MKWIKKILGITSLEQKVERLQNELSEKRKEIRKLHDDDSEAMNLIESNSKDINILRNQLATRHVRKKMKG